MCETNRDKWDPENEQVTGLTFTLCPQTSSLLVHLAAVRVRHRADHNDFVSRKTRIATIPLLGVLGGYQYRFYLLLYL